MIDRPARRILAENLRHLAAGLLTNDSYEDRIPRRSLDPAIMEIHLCGAWYLYDDLHEHKLIGRYRLSRAGMSEIARWILFLKSDHAYEWPMQRNGFLVSLLFGLVFSLGNLLSLGLLGLLFRHRERPSGDEEVWPFRRKSDFELALASPKTRKSQRSKTEFSSTDPKLTAQRLKARQKRALQRDGVGHLRVEPGEAPPTRSQNHGS